MKIGLFFLLLPFSALSQQMDSIINVQETRRIETILSADEMKGRKVYTPGIEKAADFINDEFKAAGLKSLDGAHDFRQSFSMITNTKPILKADGSIDSANMGTATQKKLTNLVGILQGHSLAKQFVIFSAHYDHLGVGKPGTNGDSVYNGANDDASGVTAILMLAKYFSALNNNERSILFVAFSGEEEGGLGSTYFGHQMDPATVAAMFNIEMIGTESKWGTNSAYITGFERSDFGQLLQKNLLNSPFHFYPDPYPDQRLFLRSDNASLARLGVPAHTISTSKMDSEKYYHTLGDEIGTLDLKNMTEVIKAIAVSSNTIVSGKDTPTRVKF